MIEIIDGVPVDWSLFKANPQKGLNRVKKAYIKLCTEIHQRGHKLVGNYISAREKITIDYNCGHKPSSVYVGSYKRNGKCPKCIGICPEQARETLLELVEKNGHILLSEYNGSKGKVLIDFNCGHEPYLIKYDSYKDGHGCPKCAGNSNEKGREDLISLINKNGHTLLSEYKNTASKVLIDFNCGHEPHWIKANSYKSGHGCPLCINKGEAALYALLLNMGYEVERQKTYDDLKDTKLLPYDFYLPRYNLLVELDGDHHRKPIVYSDENLEEAENKFKDKQRKDELKNSYATLNNIPLLRIEYNKGRRELDKWKQLILNKIKEMDYLNKSKGLD